jgi:hypothetical protein
VRLEGGTAGVVVCAGCGVAGGVGCGVGLTTTTWGALTLGGVVGNSTVGRPVCGFGCARDVFVLEPDNEAGLGFAVPEPDAGAGRFRAARFELRNV